MSLLIHNRKQPSLYNDPNNYRLDTSLNNIITQFGKNNVTASFRSYVHLEGI